MFKVMGFADQKVINNMINGGHITECPHNTKDINKAVQVRDVPTAMLQGKMINNKTFRYNSDTYPDGPVGITNVIVYSDIMVIRETMKFLISVVQSTDPSHEDLDLILQTKIDINFKLSKFIIFAY